MPDGTVLARVLTGGHRLVAATARHLHGHVDLTFLGQVRDDVLGVGDLDTVRQGDVGGGDDLRPIHLQTEARLAAVLHHQRDALQV
jgi:hypothetical protein